jgi:hypothetical protein
MAVLDLACQLALEAALMAAGYYRHNYGAWGEVVVYGKPSEVEPARAAEDELRGLLARARAGDAAVLPALRAALDGRPELLRTCGDLASRARDAWLGLVAGPDLALKESLGWKAAAMLDELAGPAAAPIERLLAERVVATWLEMSYADVMAEQAAGASPRQASFVLKRQVGAPATPDRARGADDGAEATPLGRDRRRCRGVGPALARRGDRAGRQGRPGVARRGAADDRGRGRRLGRRPAVRTVPADEPARPQAEGRGVVGRVVSTPGGARGVGRVPGARSLSSRGPRCRRASGLVPACASPFAQGEVARAPARRPEPWTSPTARRKVS